MSLSNTSYGAAVIAEIMQKAHRVHFIGVGGIHMSSLARLTRARGYAVTGSDCTESDATASLRGAGIPVSIGHDATLIRGADAVVFTLALAPDDPEYVAARAAGVPCISRADYLGWLMTGYERRIGVAGSHGKSTVTAWLGELLAAPGDPTVLCGASVRAFHAPFRMGMGSDIVFEACEYRDSFLHFSPTLSLLLNVALDHVDYFPDLAAIKRSFASFAALPGERGTVIYCADDADAAEVARKSPAHGVSFGLSEGADYRAADVRFEMGQPVFRLITPTGDAGEVKLRTPGLHNVQNALAVSAAAEVCHVPRAALLSGLAAFGGAGRRMEYRGLWHGARLYDDYAHHPAEIAAALRVARQLADGGRLFAVFQSHTYSRTAAFFEEICTALRAADRVFVADIYPARETETLGMSGARLAAGVGKTAAWVGDLPKIAAALAEELAAGDLLLVMGAGNIDRIFGEFSEKRFTE